MQVVTNWNQLATEEWLQDQEVESDWEKAKGHKGHIKGPIHQTPKLLQELKIESDGPIIWKVNNLMQVSMKLTTLN